MPKIKHVYPLFNNMAYGAEETYHKLIPPTRTINGYPISADITIPTSVCFNGNGSPIGVVTPTQIGDRYIDKTAPTKEYYAFGLTNNDWQEVQNVNL